jgi:amino acid adenylation domain-containing protein
MLNVDTGVCAHELFEAAARRWPEAIALVFGDEQLRYQELDRRANQLAHYLRSRGVGPEALVGLYVDRSLDMIVGIFGILKAGGGYVPIDPEYPPGRVAYMLEEPGVRLVLTHARLMERLSPEGPPAIALDTSSRVVSALPDHAKAGGAGPENVAYVIFTSGSTGRPKGVQIPHRALVNLLRSTAREPGLTPQDVFLAVTTLSFDISNLELLLPLVVGGRTVIADRATATDGSRLLARIASAGATVVQGTPSTFRLLLEAGWDDSLRVRSFCGGEAWPSSLARALVARSAEVWNMYGPTETTVWSSVGRVLSGDGPLSLGGPHDRTTKQVHDAALPPVIAGEPGEIFIGGAGVARGYLRRPALTAERFLPDPFSEVPGARMYRVGDRGRLLPDGTLECLGRVDHQLKIRGYRIEPGEISAVLEEHPFVSQAVVVAHEPRPGDLQLVAYFIPRDEVTPLAELREHLTTRLPSYMIPSSFVPLREMPLTPNGKIDRNNLPAPSWDHHVTAGYVEPATPAERALAEIWSQVLGVPRVGAEDDFFLLGGTSFTALQVVSLAAERGLRLTMAEIRENLRLCQLALKASQQPSPRPVPVEAAGPLGTEPRAASQPVPLTVGQRLSLPRSGHDDFKHPNLNTHAVFVSPHPIDLEVARAAMRCIVEHHEALRLRLRYTPPGEEGQNSGWSQTIARADDTPHVVRLDPSRFPAAPDEQTALRLAMGELHDSIHPVKGPLIRIGLFDWEAKHYLIYVVSGLVSDGYSDRVLMEDFQLAYGQLASGKPATLPRVGTSFSKWCEQLYRPIDLPEEVLARLPARPPSPARPRGPLAASVVAIKPDEIQALRSQGVRVRGVRLPDVLVAALAITLTDGAAVREVPLALLNHGRSASDPSIDLSRTTGHLALAKMVQLTVPDHGAPWDRVLSIRDQILKIGSDVDAANESVQCYHHRSPHVRDRLAQLCEQTVQVNFHPEIRNIVRPGALPLTLDIEDMVYWQPLFSKPAPPQEMDSTGWPRLGLTVIDSATHFICGFTFDTTWHVQEDVDRLARAYLGCLRSLLPAGGTS